MPSSRGIALNQESSHTSIMSPALTGELFATNTTWEAQILVIVYVFMHAHSYLFNAMCKTVKASEEGITALQQECV